MAAPTNAVRFNATTSGIGDFIVASAPAGYVVPEAANVTDGKTYKYYAQSADGSMWEAGSGAYTVSTHTLARTSIAGTSNADQSPVNFLTIPIVDVYASPTTLLEPKVARLPTTQSLTSGTGSTYTTPTGCTWIEVFMVGGGGGGGGAPSSGSTLIAGSDGTASSFNGVNANPGKGAPATGAAGVGGAGGSAGTGTATRRKPGGPGGTGYALTVSSNVFNSGGSGSGGVSHFGGGGQGVAPTTSPLGAAGQSGGANTGSGGSGGAYNQGGANPNGGSGGGGAGEFVDLLIASPSATYAYTIGAGGAGGSSGANGGSGGSGFIFVVEHYGS